MFFLNLCLIFNLYTVGFFKPCCLGLGYKIAHGLQKTLILFDLEEIKL